MDHAISISKYYSLAGSSCIKLPKELVDTRKGLINIQNTDDNQSFKWCFVRHLKTLGEKHYVLINDFSCIIIQYIVEKNFLSLLFTRFDYRRNIKTLY